MTPQYDVAVSDVVHGMANWRMWGRLGLQENKRRYRRTMIGPFWTTLSLGVFIFALGIVWSQLWKQDPKNYVPFLASGMIVWALVGTVISEGCLAFVSAEGLIKSLPINYTILACAVVWRNVIALAHHFVIFLAVAIYGNVSINWNSLLVIPGILLVSLNGVWICISFGLLCARYRDIQQVVTTILQIAMFVTPIFWSAEQIGDRFMAVVDFNFLYHLVDVIRSPMLGKAPSSWSYGYLIAVTVLGWMSTLIVFSRFRRRVAFWL
jgi:ABC-type polysaccharide/polyol phosphate export permease